MDFATYAILLAGALAGGFVSGLAGFGTALMALGIWLYILPPAVRRAPGLVPDLERHGARRRAHPASRHRFREAERLPAGALGDARHADRRPPRHADLPRPERPEFLRRCIGAVVSVRSGIGVEQHCSEV